MQLLEKHISHPGNCCHVEKKIKQDKQFNQILQLAIVVCPFF